MQKDVNGFVEALDNVFSEQKITITHNRNSSGNDTISLTFDNLGRSFIFDSETGKYLGHIAAMPDDRSMMPKDMALTPAIIPDHGAVDPLSGVLMSLFPQQPQVVRKMICLKLPSPENVSMYSSDIEDLMIKKFGK